MKRAHRCGGSTLPSRTAAIGGIDVARNAGRRLASKVTTIPTRSETTIVRVANTVPVFGRSIPNETKSEFRPFASPTPRKRPTTEAIVPSTSASTRTEPRTCRRVAPSVRSVANSLVRCAIVIESVFAITKAPTNRATAPKASRNFCRKPRNAVVSFESFFACCAALVTCAVGGRICRISDTSRAVGTFGCAATRIRSSLLGLRNSCCAVGRSKIASVAPPIEETEASSAIPVTRNRSTGPRACTPIGLPTL